MPPPQARRPEAAGTGSGRVLKCRTHLSTPRKILSPDRDWLEPVASPAPRVHSIHVSGVGRKVKICSSDSLYGFSVQGLDCIEIRRWLAQVWLASKIDFKTYTSS